jgi:hypothetical protein
MMLLALSGHVCQLQEKLCNLMVPTPLVFTKRERCTELIRYKPLGLNSDRN